MWLFNLTCDKHVIVLHSAENRMQVWGHVSRMNRNVQLLSGVSEWSRVTKYTAFLNKLNKAIGAQSQSSTTAASSSATAVLSTTCVSATIDFWGSCDGLRDNRRGGRSSLWSWEPITNWSNTEEEWTNQSELNLNIRLMWGMLNLESEFLASGWLLVFNLARTVE